MGVENLGEAIRHLKLLLRGGANVQDALLYICSKYAVVERALRRWFEENTGKAPEEYRELKWKSVTIDSAIAAAASRWVKNGFGPNLVGRRFFVDLDRPNEPGKQVRRWYRYIGFTGHAIEAIDEETLNPMKFDGGPEIWAEIREIVKAAAPYELAEKIEYWGCNEEQRAREGILNTIRLVLLRECQGLQLKECADVVDERLRSAPTLTLIYQSLTPKQRKDVDLEVNNPPVQLITYEGGQRRSHLLEPQLQILKMLQDGDDVQSPIHERV